jgi:hypothetical protein
MTTRKLAILMALAVAAIGPQSCNKENGPVAEAVSNKDIYRDAYIYGFPMVMNYGVMYAYFVDRNSRLHSIKSLTKRVCSPPKIQPSLPRIAIHLILLSVLTCVRNQSFCAFPRLKKPAITMCNWWTCIHSTMAISEAAQLAMTRVATWSLGQIGRAKHQRESIRYFILKLSLVWSATGRNFSDPMTCPTSRRCRLVKKSNRYRRLLIRHLHCCT